MHANSGIVALAAALAGCAASRQEVVARLGDHIHREKRRYSRRTVRAAHKHVQNEQRPKFVCLAAHVRDRHRRPIVAMHGVDAIFARSASLHRRSELSRKSIPRGLECRAVAFMPLSGFVVFAPSARDETPNIASSHCQALTGGFRARPIARRSYCSPR